MLWRGLEPIQKRINFHNFSRLKHIDNLGKDKEKTENTHYLSLHYFIVFNETSETLLNN